MSYKFLMCINLAVYVNVICATKIYLKFISAYIIIHKIRLLLIMRGHCNNIIDILSSKSQVLICLLNYAQFIAIRNMTSQDSYAHKLLLYMTS